MEDLQIFEEIVRLKQNREPAVLAVVIESSGSSPRKPGTKMVVHDDGSVHGTVGGGKVEADTIATAMEVLKSGLPQTLSFSLTEETGFACGGKMSLYIEPLVLSPRLVIIGAGHVGQALRGCAGQVGFEVQLVDPYPSSSIENVGFKPADLKCTIEEIFTRVTFDYSTSIVIATRDHGDDFLLIKKALATQVFYIGLIGSKRKRSALRSYLEEEGLPAESFDRVTTPVGLDIGAQTPEEIAISITAQLIQLRRKNENSSHGNSSGSRKIEENGTIQTTPSPW